MIESQSNIDIANDLVKQQQFVEAGKIFHQLWDDQKNGYAASRYLHCLRKAGHPEWAIKQGEKAYQEFPDNIYVQRELIWSYYDQIKRLVTEKDLKEVITLASSALKLKPEDLPLELIIMAIVKLAKEQQQWEIVITWCRKIKVNQFTKNSGFNSENKKGKSNQESWFFAYLKALMKLNNWPETRTVALQALQIYPQEINFKRWYALSLAHLGDADQAIAKLKELLLKDRQEWYLFEDLGELYLQINDQEAALRYFCKAALATREDSLKVSLYQSIAQVALSLNQLEIATKHLQLSQIIRQNEGWKIKDSLKEIESKIKQRYVENNLNWVNFSQEELQKFCLKTWRQESYRGLSRNYGIIESLPQDKSFGWIKSDTGSKIFFLQRDLPSFLRQENVKVSFVLEETWDRKKNQLSVKAVDIQRKSNL
jgi:tetratricopeptide (TPR) repeat protein